MTSSGLFPSGPTSTGRLRCGRGPTSLDRSSMFKPLELDVAADGGDAANETW